jgi:hyperosmotically inducible protein
MSRLCPTFVAAAALGAAISLTPAHSARAQSVQDEATAVRQDLRALPEYGVFDLITFQVNPDHSVTLGGYVTLEDTKKHAEHAIANDKSVTLRVDNKIELAPISTTDDRMRHEVFAAIYGDKFLSKYGTPEEMAAAEHTRRSPWGDGFGTFGEFGSARWTGAPFYGQEPIGNYAIHILVKHGTVTLAGIVGSQEDKDTAGRDAMRALDVHDMNNDLHVGKGVSGRP